MGKGTNKETKSSALRHRAEKRFSETWTSMRPPTTQEDNLKLIHELQVHQIELEMQNEELTQARTEMEEGLEKYSVLYDFAPVGYFTLTDDGIIKEVNLTGASLLGVTRSHLINQHFSTYLSPEAHPVFVEFLRKVLGDTREKTCEVMLSGNENNPRYVHIVGTAVKGKGWQCVIGVLDITERKRVEAEKRKLENQLARIHKMETVGTFAGGIAHDFNNILAAIIGYAELALINVERTDLGKVSNNLAGVLKAGKRAKDLVSQILSFSRHDERQHKSLLFHETIKDSLRMLRSIIPASIKLRQNLPPSGMVMGDPVQLHQLMMNLCSNAVQAMSETGGVLNVSLKEVTVWASTIHRHSGRQHDQAQGRDFKDHGLELLPGPYIRLTVSDTGRGMTPEVMERIFEPYFTTRDIGSGSGLGLSVVHGIVKKHKGAIICQSEPKKGTTFHIYLPLGEFKEGTQESPSELAIFSGTERILFIDDEPDLADIIKKALESMGYNVTSTTSSGDALEIFKKNPDSFALVITDMTMPDMMGDALAQSLMGVRHDIPIILCSGYGEHISEEKLKSIGIQEYVMKPFMLADLAKSIRKVLDKSQA